LFGLRLGLYNRWTMVKRSAFALLLIASLTFAQDRSSWQALSQLQTGDQVKLSLKSHGDVTGPFQTWTPEQVTVGSTTAKREDVAKLERYGKGGWGRGKKALVGALIGGGAGAAIGIAAGGCSDHGFGPCFTRAQTGAAAGAAGAVMGTIVGALLPHHRTNVIYAAR
jgi:hypothetical protein